MKKFILMTTGLVFAAGAALANDGLVSKMNDPAQWAIQTGDYKNQRHSKLTQITKENVGDLQVFVTHDAEEANALADRILYLSGFPATI
jgi:glucose dehydrogenase